MNCFYCNSLIEEDEPVCSHCGADNKAYHMIIQSSNIYYNEGLNRAKIRDLYGAAESLNRSLRYNKYHIDARNLLGLVYFEVGETVLALREWVISKNLSPENNEADTYLHEIQYGPGMLEKLDQTTKKFNQAIAYCEQGNRDLARIQLRRVLGNNPKMVRAHQLLALLCMQDGEYDEARKSLNAASKIDVKNQMTVTYMQEVKAVLKAKNAAANKKKRKNDVIGFQDGNDTVMMPRQTFMEALDNSKSGMINILVGAGLGLLICIFLIVPTVRQNANSSAANALVNANEDAVSTQTTVTSLKKQVADLKEQLKAYEGKGDLATSYEKLLEAQAAYSKNDLATASVAMDTVNRDLLDTQGQALYDTIVISTNDYKMSENYNMGNSQMLSKDYQNAIQSFLIVVGIDEKYKDGQALYSLAECYSNVWDFKNAMTYYSKVVELFPNTNKASASQSKIDQINAATAANGTAATGTATNGTVTNGTVTNATVTTTQ